MIFLSYSPVSLIPRKENLGGGGLYLQRIGFGWLSPIAFVGQVVLCGGRCHSIQIRDIFASGPRLESCERISWETPNLSSPSTQPSTSPQAVVIRVSEGVEYGVEG